jgi:hypothetical protein
MSNYVKDKTFQFQLINESVEKEHMIWKSHEKRFAKPEEFLHQDGSVMKFPLRHGTIPDAQGNWYDAAQCLQMNTKDFKAMFPNFKLDVKFKRDVLVNGQAMIANFPYSAEKKLSQLIAMCKSMNGNPLLQVFRQVYNKDAVANEMYNIEVLGSTQSVPNVAPASSGKFVPQPLPQQGYAPPMGQMAPQMPQQPMYQAPQQMMAQTPQMAYPPQVNQMPTQQVMQPQQMAQQSTLPQHGIPNPMPQYAQQQPQMANPFNQAQPFAQPAPQYSVPQPIHNPLQQAHGIPDAHNVVLTDLEKDFVDVIISNFGFDSTQDQFVKNAVANGIKDVRAIELYLRAYKK